MKKTLVTIIALVLCGTGAFAQEAKKENKASVSLHGFIRNF